VSASSPHPVRRGYSIRVFLPDGDPEGIKIVEKFNWSGIGLVIPRSLFAHAKREHPELGRTGVYMLVGAAEDSALPHVYIGEGDPILPRLEQHALKRDFWTHLIAFTGSDQNQNLNKAHVQHLEARLVEIARAAKRSVLGNGNTPQPPTLSRADRADTENFLADLLLCLPVLGYPFFEMPSGGVPASERTTTRRSFFLKSKGIAAKGYESAAGFVVEAGSTAVSTEVPSIHDFLKRLRADLLTQGVLVPADKGRLKLTQDYTFTSPSNAAGVLLGRSSNGRVEWTTAEGVSLKTIQEKEAMA
jgi:hypothetical protein